MGWNNFIMELQCCDKLVGLSDQFAEDICTKTASLKFCFGSVSSNDDNNINDLYSANSSELLTSTFKSRSLTSVKLFKQMGLQIFLEAF